MFNLTPFSTKEPDIFDYLDALNRNASTTSSTGYAQFHADIYEKGGDYFLRAELPGFEKEEISIDLKGNILSITACHKEAEKTETATEEKINYIHREIRKVNYKRSFNIEGIDVPSIKAAYNNGILELTLPKVTPKKPEGIKIAVD